MTAQAADTWEVVTDPEQMRALEAEWDALWDRAGDAYATQRFAWCWAAWTTVARPLGRRLHCVVGRCGGRLVVAWPFVVYRHGPWIRARPLSPEVAEYSAVLIERDERTRARVAAAWAELCRTARADAILLPYVPVGTTLHAFMSEQRGPMLLETTALSSTRADDDAGRAAFVEMRESKSLAKHRRRLERRGEVRIERITDPARRAEIITWTLRLKEAWLARTGGSALWHDTALYRDFLVAIAPDARLEVFALTLTGAPVATCIARVDNRRFEQFLSTYDVAHRDCSPGQLLRVADMAWAFERGLEYDLRVGEHPYKKDWTNRRSEAISYHVANSLWGRVAIAARKAQRGLQRRAS